MWEYMEKEEKFLVGAFGAAFLGVILVSLVYVVKDSKIPKFEGVVTQIIEDGEKTEVFFEDGTSTFFLKDCNPRIVCVEVGDTLTYRGGDGIHGAEYWGLRSSSNEADKRALYKERTGVKGVIARIEFGYLRSSRYRDASVLFTDGVTKMFSLSSNPQMACAEVGDTLVYKGNRCVSFRPHLTTAAKE